MRFLKTLIFATILFSCCESFAQQSTIFDDIAECFINEDVSKTILAKVKQKDPNAVKSLPNCFKLDRKLMLQVALIDPLQFENAADFLKSDPIFIKRLIKFSPQILQFAGKEIRRDKDFMERATYISRNSLQYADPILLNDRPFMKKMITIDSQNYVFASDRLKAMPELANIAFSDNGLLLSSAPLEVKSNKKLVKTAVKSNHLALSYAADDTKEDKHLKMIADQKSSINKESLENFLKINYITEEKKKNLGSAISNQAFFFKDNQIIDRNYITKWQRSLDFSNREVSEDLRLITADSRNYPTLWREDFEKYPDLIKKIEKFFHNHQVASNVVDNLKTTFLWKIKDRPETFAFNLYLLRNSSDIELGPDFVNVTSITAVAQKRQKKWHMTIVEVVIDSEIKVDVSYSNGHKKYVLWDLYQDNEDDKNPKIIFKVEDKFDEYFETFEEQNNGKYHMMYRFDPLSDEFENSTKNLF